MSERHAAREFLTVEITSTRALESNDARDALRETTRATRAARRRARRLDRPGRSPPPPPEIASSYLSRVALLKRALEPRHALAALRLCGRVARSRRRRARGRELGRMLRVSRVARGAAAGPSLRGHIWGRGERVGRLLPSSSRARTTTTTMVARARTRLPTSSCAALSAAPWKPAYLHTHEARTRQFNSTGRGRFRRRFQRARCVPRPRWAGGRETSPKQRARRAAAPHAASRRTARTRPCTAQARAAC